MATPEKSHTQNWSELGQSVTERDLGYQIDSPVPEYDLSDTTKKRLLVHARHDAATAVIGTSETYDMAKIAAKRSTLALIFAFVGMCASLLTAFEVL